jgi:hypothetical protein
MKTYSFIVICLTLGLFYSLAVKMEHQKKQESIALKMQSSTVNHNTDLDLLTVKKHCSKNSIMITSDTKLNHHVDINDDFSMHVTGKEHRYLNTGVSFIEHKETSDQSNISITAFSGS